MGVMQRVVKPKNQRAKRALEAREPKSIELVKTALFIKGAKCSSTMQTVLKDLCALKQPHASALNQKNDIRPFEDHSKLEWFGKKNDASLFAFGCHNKKRPNNLILGRMYDYQLLDMIELGVAEYKALAEFKGDKIPAGIKPCLTFSGAWESTPELKRLKSLLIDFFRGPEITNVSLRGLEHTIQFTVDEASSRVYVRSYKVLLKKSSDPKLPRVELEEMGPSLDLVLRRTHLASDDLYKTANRYIKNLGKVKKVKNQETDELGNRLGTVHKGTQDLDQLQTRKMKALKAERKERLAEKRAKAKSEREENVEKVFGDEEDEDDEDMDDDDDDDEGSDDDGSEEEMDDE